MRKNQTKKRNDMIDLLLEALSGQDEGKGEEDVARKKKTHILTKDQVLHLLLVIYIKLPYT